MNLVIHQAYPTFKKHSLTPFELLITTASVYLLERLVLAPLIDPFAEKFNWVNAVKKYLKPIQPFDLTINLTDDNLIIEAPLGTSHNITAEIWAVIKRTLEILEQENRLDKASRIRFTPSQTDELLIICYEGGKPKRLVNLGAGETVEIPEGQISDDEDTELSADDWLKQQLDKSERYRQFVAKFK